MPFSIGENVGPYRIVDQLGHGGMATVYRAYHANLDRFVAIKVLHAALKTDPTFAERFRREAQIVARLEHPNIVPVYDYNEHQGEPYLVMKFVEGETLKARMARQQTSVQDAIHIVTRVGSALTYAHERDVLHRDVKPSNILIDAQGEPHLADFGLARMASAGESTLSQDMMLGTPQYISPEQAQGVRQLSPATDIYSLGVVLYELIVGRVPFSADTPYAIIANHIYSPLPLPSKVNPEVPPAVERVLLKVLSKDPADRYARATDFAEAFRQAANTMSAPPAQPSGESTAPGADRQTIHLNRRAAPAPAPMKRQQATILWWLAGIAAVLLIIAVLLLAGTRRQEQLAADTTRLAEAPSATRPLVTLTPRPATATATPGVMIAMASSPSGAATGDTDEAPGTGPEAAATEVSLSGETAPAASAAAASVVPSAAAIGSAAGPGSPEATLNGAVPASAAPLRPGPIGRRQTATALVAGSVGPALPNTPASPPAVAGPWAMGTPEAGAPDSPTHDTPIDPIALWETTPEQAQRRIDANPGDPLSYLAMAVAIARSDADTPELQRVFREAVVRAVESPRVLLEMAQALQQLDERYPNQKVESMAGTLAVYAYLSGAERNVLVYEEAGEMVYAYAGAPELPNNHATILRAVAEETQAPFVYAAWALAAHVAGQHDDADRAMERATALGRDLPEVRLVQGILLKAQGNNVAAGLALRAVADAPAAPAWVREEARRLLRG